jgi:hypothetical protein
MNSPFLKEDDFLIFSFFFIIIRLIFIFSYRYRKRNSALGILGPQSRGLKNQKSLTALDLLFLSLYTPIVKVNK